MVTCQCYGPYRYGTVLQEVMEKNYVVRGDSFMQLDLAEWLERLTANVEVASVLGYPSIFRHSGIWGAADEAGLNKVRIKKSEKSPCFFYGTNNLDFVPPKFSIWNNCLWVFWPYLFKYIISTGTVPYAGNCDLGSLLHSKVQSVVRIH